MRVASFSPINVGIPATVGECAFAAVVAVGALEVAVDDPGETSISDSSSMSVDMVELGCVCTV